MDVFQQYIESIEDRINEWVNSDAESFTVPYGEIEASDTLDTGDFIHNPERFRSAIRDALDMWLQDNHNTSFPYDMPIRLVGVPSEEKQDVGKFDPASASGDLILMRGQVANVGKRRVREEEVAFECQRCGTLTRMPQSGESLTEPYECQGCERQGPFTKNKSQSDRISFQKMELQQLPEQATRMSEATFPIELTDELVGSILPGDRVDVVVEMDDRQVQQTRYADMFGRAQSMEKLDRDFDATEIEQHRQRIEDIVDDAPFDALVDTIAPGHMGDENVKLALALMIFGGVEKSLPNGETIRGNIHIFFVGDPGAGKSSLMTSVADLVPRSVKASGQQTTSAGLTAAAVRGEFGSGFQLKAGALVEADGGIAVIDELDDMSPEDRTGLNEAMSEQEINTSKGGINATLPASCSVLAAANPEHGRFDDYESVPAQVDLTPQLLSRFDLVFTFRDEDDRDRDKSIAEHMTEQQEAGQKIEAGTATDDDVDAVTGELTPDELRSYVSMAHEISPVLTKDARDRVPDEYVNIRGSNDSEAFAVGPRMVNTVHRLAEAAARIRLSDEVTVNDIELAVKLHRRYLNDFGVDPETGEYDMDMVETGQSRTQHQREKDLKDIYRGVESRDDEPGVNLDDLIEACVEVGMDQSKVEKSLQEHRDKGEAYEPQNGRYQFIS